MIVGFYAMANAAALALLAAVKRGRRLHVLEILAYWIFGSYLFQNFSALCFMNFKTLVIPDRPSAELAHALNRLVLYPVLMVAYLHWFLLPGGWLDKAGRTAAFVAALSGLEWLSDRLGVMIHVHWRAWWTAAFWLAAGLAMLGGMRAFRVFLYERKPGA
ncbi:hypothetical protein I8J29_11380 [Paenibacillus sp. MWE-103]|uniref:Uncharacterized protein n=1 Tax=Paenibacillus artemisiicola TaxID=1172618 RepID=A0ABS3W900_9BACL|nr:hypothetical protein [Paenibacillus artemisiicola]MBO7744802.1 hypothetical protein [Paenibacillus artemisiicola]